MATSLPEGGNDTEGTDFLATQRVFSAGRPGVGLDVLATKIAVDFQGLTSEGGDSCIKRNLDALREAAELDAICIVLFNNERTVIERVASSTAVFFAAIAVVEDFLRGRRPRCPTRAGTLSRAFGESCESLPDRSRTCDLQFRKSILEGSHN